MAPLKKELQYYALKHPNAWAICKACLYVITFPLCFSFCCFCCSSSCFPSISGFCGDVRQQKIRRRQSKQRVMTMIHFEHQGRKLKRRQSLSLGTPTVFWTGPRRRSVSDQVSSPLFSKLPVEVRERIYEYVLVGTGAVHFQFGSTPGRYDQLLPLESRSCEPTRGTLEDFSSYPVFRESDATGCSLLQTCRLVYTESLPILYRNTQFVFDRTDTLKAWTHIMSKSKIRNIRSVRIDIIGSWRDRYWKDVYNEHFKDWDNLCDLYLGYCTGCYEHTHPEDRACTVDEKTEKCTTNIYVYCSS